MEVCHEQSCKCHIRNRIQDQVILKTAAFKPPPSTAISLKNSDENMRCKKVETLG